MSSANVNVDANSLGARVTISLVVLGLMLEVLSDNMQGCNQTAPMTIEACVELCSSQGDSVVRVEGWACQCNTQGATHAKATP